MNRTRSGKQKSVYISCVSAQPMQAVYRSRKPSFPDDIDPVSIVNEFFHFNIYQIIIIMIIIIIIIIIPD